MQLPMHVMDMKPDTPAGNAEAVKGIFTQASIGNSTKNSKACNFENLVVLVFSDLGTGQHLHSLMESRLEEETPWRRLQSVVFVMGFFHLKMVCTDAIWKIFINGSRKSRKTDPNSLINHVGEIQPKETGKIETKLAF